MHHRHLRTTIVLLLLATVAGAALVASARVERREAIDGPAAPADPWTARDQWVLLRGGEPLRSTPMAPPTRRLVIRQRLLRRSPVGSTHRIHRDRPDGFVPAAIVLHGTGSGQPGVDVTSLDELHRFFSGRSARGSAHYAIDRRGRILRMVRDSDAAFHVARPGWNDVSIGIELLNDNSGTEPFPAEQLESASQLVRALGTRYGIPVEGVVRHRTIQPEDRADPARNFPWRRWLATLRT